MLVFTINYCIPLFFFLDISKLSVIKERLPDHVSYGHIKLVIAILELSLGVATFSGSDYPPSQSSFTSSTRPVKTPGKPHPTPKENTARKLPVWLSGKPGGKRKNPF